MKPPVCLLLAIPAWSAPLLLAAVAVLADEPEHRRLRPTAQPETARVEAREVHAGLRELRPRNHLEAAPVDAHSDAFAGRSRAHGH